MIPFSFSLFYLFIYFILPGTQAQCDPPHVMLISNFIIIEKSTEVQPSFRTTYGEFAPQLLSYNKSVFLSNRFKRDFFSALEMMIMVRM